MEAVTCRLAQTLSTQPTLRSHEMAILFIVTRLDLCLINNPTHTKQHNSNLGRDDRCVAAHGREARFPYLDENVMVLLRALPTHLVRGGQHAYTYLPLSLPRSPD